MEKFVHLHCHTEYSLLDGAARIEPLVQAARDLGMPALAITDHGVMYGVVDFYKTARKYGVKPILGCEVYVAPRTRFDRSPQIDDQLAHLVLLAENKTGYQNLLSLVSQAHLQGFYYKPRVDLELLQEHQAGLIALSGCLAGQIPRLLLQGSEEEAREKAGQMQDIFGDRFYLELQDHGLNEQKQVNPQLLRLGRELGIPAVASNDLHYIRAEDAGVQDVLLCVQTGKTLQDQDRTLRFATQEFYLKSAAEMHLLFGEHPELLRNTMLIAERCTVELDLHSLHLPEFPVPADFTPDSYLRELSNQGMRQRFSFVESRVQERLDYELHVIQSMGFSGYFLIVQDLISWARSQGILVGPGRGSAAGSLVAYVLGITDIDPIKYKLLFERFLNPQRVSMPDIDVDFCYRRRDEVFEYVVQKYGADKVAHIITFGTLLARSGIRDVGRALGIPLREVDRIAKMVPDELGITLEKALEASPELQRAIAEDEGIRRLITITQSLEGVPRHASTHAAGLVIGNGKLTNYLPLQRTGEVVTTQFTKETVEEIGLLKMDLLGLRTLTVIDDARRLIQRTRPEIHPLDLSSLDLADPQVYTLLSRGDTIGVFQLESSGIRMLIRELKPNCFEDIIAIIALYRPGPLGSGMVEEFIKRKHGKAELTYLHSSLENILQDTYGVIVYQEQVMRIASELGELSLAEADELRQAISKKKPDLLGKFQERFLQGAANLGIPEGIAQQVFKQMEFFGGYGFNRSHTAAYAVVAYQTAYLKAHYPEEYMAALLTSVMNNLDKVAYYIEECRRLNIDILLPDINESQESFTVVGSKIRFGLAAVKQVGEGGVASILQTRKEGGAFTSLTDFCARIDTRQVNKRVIENLIRGGAFTSLGLKRAQLLHQLDTSLEMGQQLHRERSSRQMSLFDLGSVTELASDHLPPTPDIPEFPLAQLLEMEKEALGLYISGHPLQEYATKLAELGNQNVMALKELPDGKNIQIGGMVVHLRRTVTRKGDPMAYLTLEDTTGAIEVIIFPRVYEKFSRFLKPQALLQIWGRLSTQEESIRVMADKLALIEDTGEPKPKVYIRLPWRRQDKDRLKKVTGILENYPGSNQVYLFFEPERKLILTRPEFWVQITPELQMQIEALCGLESITIRSN